jgi:hypothetical protein
MSHHNNRHRRAILIASFEKMARTTLANARIAIVQTHSRYYQYIFTYNEVGQWRYWRNTIEPEGKLSIFLIGQGLVERGNDNLSVWMLTCNGSLNTTPVYHLYKSRVVFIFSYFIANTKFSRPNRI